MLLLLGLIMIVEGLMSNLLFKKIIMKKSLLFFPIVLSLFFGCSGGQLSEVAPEFFEDPIYCEVDSDCTYQEVCGCDKMEAINVYNERNEGCKDELECLVEPPKKVECVNNKCELVF